MSYVAKVTIDSTQVASDLTDFPVYINLADMPATFWSTVANGGGDIRVYKSDGTTELPREVVSCKKLTQGLVSYYKLDESSGDASDSVGSNTATNSGVTYSTGRINNGAVYDANSDRFSLGDPSNLKFGTTFSLSGWINMASVNRANLDPFFYKGNDGVDFGCIQLWWTGTNTLQFRLNANRAVNSPVTCTSSALTIDSNWHLAVATYDGATMRLFWDGVQVASQATTITPDPTGNWYIGNTNSTRSVNKTLDEMGMWNRTLSAEEIAILYNSGSGIQASDYTEGTGELHVKYSGTLSSSVDTEIQIHADGTSADYATNATYGAENVWNSNYAGVYHLEGTSTDSTSNSIDGTDTSITYGTTYGLIGQGADFDANTDRISLGSGATAIRITGAMTVTCKYKYDNTTNPPQHQSVLSRGGWRGASAFAWSFAHSSTGNIQFGVSNGGTTEKFVAINQATAGINDQAFHHYAFTYNPSTRIEIFIDGTGVANNTTSIPSATQATYETTMGDNPNDDPTVFGLSLGSLDEVRIHSGVLSNDWIAAEYTNQNTPTTFYTATTAALTANITDTMALSDSNTAIRTRLSTTTDTLDLTENISALKVMFATIVDTVSMSETVSNLRIMVANIVDTLGMTETATAIRKWEPKTKNSASFTEKTKNSSTWTERTKN